MRISIDGNIGAGKTTLLRALSAEGCFCYEEPVAEWQETGLL